MCTHTTLVFQVSVVMASDKSFPVSSLSPPEDIRVRLSPLHGLCTYTLLEDLRYGCYDNIDWDVGRVAGGIGEWFGQLRETTSEWSYRPQDRGETVSDSLARGGMLSHQWGCMGEELLALDRATRVPRDAPQIHRVYEAVRSVPEWVTRGFDADIDVFPIGSFPCDAKVNNMDEVDFLLAVHMADRHKVVVVDKLAYKIQSLLPTIPGSRIDFYQDEGGACIIPEPHVTAVYAHGPAWCVQLTWRCHLGHVHHIDIDQTISYYPTDTRNIRDLLSGMEARPVLGEAYGNIHESEKTIVLFTTAMKMSLIITFSTVERRIMEAMERLSHTILPAYRLLKVIVSRALPCTLSANGSLPSGHETSAIMSSYNVKQILYKHVLLHPTADAWSVPNLHIRVADMLEDIGRHLGLNLWYDFSKCELEIRTSTAPGTLYRELDRVPVPQMMWRFSKHSRVKQFDLLETLGHHKDGLTALVSLLRGSYKVGVGGVGVVVGGAGGVGGVVGGCEHHLSHIRDLHPARTKLLVVGYGCLHRCGGDPALLYTLGDGDSIRLVYTFPQPSMLYRTHPLIQWLEQRKEGLYLTNSGTDISQIPRSTFPWMWALYRGGIYEGHTLCDPRVVANGDELGKRLCKVLSVDRRTLIFAFSESVSLMRRLQVVCACLPDGYRNPSNDVMRTLLSLSPRNRALIQALCSRCQDLDVTCIKRIVKTQKNDELERLRDYLVEMNHCNFQLKREPLNPYYLFIFLSFSILCHNAGYFDSVTVADTIWADDVITKVSDRKDLDSYSDSDSEPD